MKGIIVAILFIGAGVGVRQYAFPAVTHIKELRTQLTDMESLEEKAIGAEKQREEAVARLNSISESNLVQLDLILPERPPTEDLYVYFELIGRQAGFAKIDSIKVNDTSAVSRGATQVAQGRKALLFEVAVSGKFSNIRRFVEALEKNARLSNVRSLDVIYVPQKDYTAKIQGNLYYVD